MLSQLPTNLNKLDPRVMDLIFGGRRTYVQGSTKGGGRKEMIYEMFLQGTKKFKTANALGLSGLLEIAKHKVCGNWDELTLTQNQLEEIMYIGTGMKGKIKVEHCDPARLKDTDSLEDWSYKNAMMHAVRGNEKSIYPFYDDIVDFRENVMPKLNLQLELYHDYPSYMNALFNRFGLIGPYDSEGKFRSTIFGLQQISDDVKLHQEFVKGLN